jgi:hypothetical protein
MCSGEKNSRKLFGKFNLRSKLNIACEGYRAKCVRVIQQSVWGLYSKVCEGYRAKGVRVNQQSVWGIYSTVCEGYTEKCVRVVQQSL